MAVSYTHLSAMASVLLNHPVEEMTGRGAGLSTAGLNKKIKTIRRAIAMHKPDREDPVDVLSKVGGFDSRHDRSIPGRGGGEDAGGH